MVMSNQYLEQRRKEQLVMEFAPIVEQVAHRLKYAYQITLNLMS